MDPPLKKKLQDNMPRWKCSCFIVDDDKKISSLLDQRVEQYPHPNPTPSLLTHKVLQYSHFLDNNFHCIFLTMTQYPNDTNKIIVVEQCPHHHFFNTFIQKIENVIDFLLRFTIPSL
jgi:hypothetical protein